MHRINCWNDLRAFGIDVLTAEACGLSYRLLCDVTQRAKLTIQKTLGVADLGLQDNWNRGDPNDPAVGSIMLVPELLIPLAIFALLEHGCREVCRTRSGMLVGIEPGDDPEQVDAVKRMYTERDDFLRRYAYAGTAGDRNRHQTTGRVV